MNLNEALLSVDPKVYERCQRLIFAVRLLRANHSIRETQDRVQVHFKVSKTTAWRVVDMARDLS